MSKPGFPRAQKRLIIWMICLNFFIIIGAGHGIGSPGLIDMFAVTQTLSGRIFGNENVSLVVASLFSFIGQVLLVLSLVVKPRQKKPWMLLWIGFYYPTHDVSDPGSQIGLFTGVPF